ncbi:hypothetical protein DAPPUDRAFT_119449 [Daphnia pulex]|uniref:Uncharacterized protein n=1 Tax=Daphnia pulex TaxID=6669 RepID=E9HYJ8_DAPPU|nr:hypothetical protein DAPPUDRAFT_119449 [Daphnia pulex]|eukprot:EFX63183.1 hypothetical protein DAPPUDRAFT_119449 [Daphnia pulex]
MTPSSFQQTSSFSIQVYYRTAVDSTHREVTSPIKPQDSRSKSRYKVFRCSVYFTSTSKYYRKKQLIENPLKRFIYLGKNSPLFSCVRSGVSLLTHLVLQNLVLIVNGMNLVGKKAVENGGVEGRQKEQERLDILAITETWLTVQHGEDKLLGICPDGFVAVHNPRIMTSGGGVALLFRSTIRVGCLFPVNFTASSFEYLATSLTEPPWSLACACHVISKEEDLPLCPTDAKTLRLYACHTRGAKAFSFCVLTINNAGTIEVLSGILPAWASETQAALYAVNQALQRASSSNLLYHRAEIVSQFSAFSFAFPRAKLTGLQAINLELLTFIKESSTVFACHDSRSSAGLMLAMAYCLLAAGPNVIPPTELAPLLPSKLCAKRETCAVILKLWNREWAQSDTGKITRLFFPNVSSARTLLRRPLSSQLTQILTACSTASVAWPPELAAIPKNPVVWQAMRAFIHSTGRLSSRGLRRAVAIPATVRYSLEGPTKPARHIKVRLEAGAVPDP